MVREGRCRSNICCCCFLSGARARDLTAVSVLPQASCLAVSKLGLRILEVGHVSLLPQPAQHCREPAPAQPSSMQQLSGMPWVYPGLVQACWALLCWPSPREPPFAASNCSCCAVPQIVFALIAFAAAASLYNGYDDYKVSFVQFMVFTGVMGFLIAIFYAIVSCVEGLKRTFSGLLEVMANTLWVIFWLAAAASFAAYQPCKIKDADYAKFTKCDVFLASQAFAWLSWFLWIGSLMISVIEMRNGEGLTGGEGRSTREGVCGVGGSTVSYVLVAG